MSAGLINFWLAFLILSFANLYLFSAAYYLPLPSLKNCTCNQETRQHHRHLAKHQHPALDRSRCEFRDSLTVCDLISETANLKGHVATTLEVVSYVRRTLKGLPEMRIPLQENVYVNEACSVPSLTSSVGRKFSSFEGARVERTDEIHRAIRSGHLLLMSFVDDQHAAETGLKPGPLVYHSPVLANLIDLTRAMKHVRCSFEKLSTLISSGPSNDLGSRKQDDVSERQSDQVEGQQTTCNWDCNAFTVCAHREHHLLHGLHNILATVLTVIDKYSELYNCSE